MNSTNLAKQFFLRHITPLSDALYVSPARKDLNESGDDLATFYISGAFGPDFCDASYQELSNGFHDLWSASDADAEMLQLVNPLLTLADKLYAKYNYRTRDLSETSYVMY